MGRRTDRRAVLLALLTMMPAAASAAPPPARPAPAQPHGDPGCLPRASDGRPEPGIEEKHAAGIAVMRRMYGEAIATQALTPPAATGVTPDLGGISTDNIMGGLWARCGLTGRERSLVNLGILIALRANGQMAEHFRVGLRNGLTKRELEEVIYQAAGYAGMPAAANAREVLIQVLQAKGAK